MKTKFSFFYFFVSLVALFLNVNSACYVLGQNITLEEALNQADILLNTREYRQALAKFDSIATIQPQNMRAIAGRAYCKYYLKDYEGALTDYNLILKLDDKNVTIYRYRGNVKQRLGRIAEACADWQKAAELGDNKVQDRIKDLCQKFAENNLTTLLVPPDTSQGISRGMKFTSPPPLEMSEAEKIRIAAEELTIGFEKIQKNDWESAEKAFNKALEYNPTQAAAYYGRANVKIAKKDFENALNDLEKALLLDPSLLNAHLLKGRILMQKNDFEQAYEHLKLASRQEHLPPYLFSYLGITEVQIEEWEKALENFTQAIQANDKQVSDFTGKTDYYHRGQVYFYLKKYKEAYNDFVRHTILFPEDSTAYLQIAQIYYEEGNLNKACELWNKYKGVSSTVPNKIQESCNLLAKGNIGYEEYVKQAQYLLNTAQPAQALFWLNQAITQYNQDTTKPEIAIIRQILFFRGIALLDLNRFDEAIVDFTFCLENLKVATPNPSDKDLYYHRGLAYRKKSQYANACADFGKALQQGMTEAQKYLDYTCE
ncbi:MAG: tetratricopeptide repeat protein [Microscillaceae bacterium]|nr:tetratricopeptide repeat protein [Microscillaceae bacterium]MDW8460422.1 tetratricopeptide repeat protein [Cytophagales bacterium]